jgi:hypothetical protein
MRMRMLVVAMAAHLFKGWIGGEREAIERAAVSGPCDVRESARLRALDGGRSCAALTAARRHQRWGGDRKQAS